MNQQDSITAQYQVIGKDSFCSNVWAEFDNWLDASNYARALREEISNISFHVNDIKPPTDEEVQEWFSHLDFGVN